MKAMVGRTCTFPHLGGGGWGVSTGVNGKRKARQANITHIDQDAFTYRYLSVCVCVW